MFDDGDKLVEVFGRLAEPLVAHAAFAAGADEYRTERIFLREKARAIRRYDEPQG